MRGQCMRNLHKRFQQWRHDCNPSSAGIPPQSLFTFCHLFALPSSLSVTSGLFGAWFSVTDCAVSMLADYQHLRELGIVSVLLWHSNVPCRKPVSVSHA